MAMSQTWTAGQRSRPSERERIRRAVIVAVRAALGSMALVLVVRRLSGGIERLPGPSVACILATLAAIASLGLMLLRRKSAAKDGMQQIVDGVVVLIPPFAMGVALMPAASTAGICYLAALFAVTSAAFLKLDGSERGQSGGLFAGSERSPLPFGPDFPAEENSVEPPAGALANRPLQWMSRTLGDDGREYVEGTVAVHFAADQKQATAHLAFCPPLAELPEVECEVLDESDVRVKTGAVYPYGVRIEARRTGAIDRPETVQVGYTASARQGALEETAGG